VKRSANASKRQIVLVKIRIIAERANWIKSTWKVPTTVYVEPANRQPGESLHLRPRQEDEYPENRADAWYDLARQAAAMAREAEQLRAFAMKEYERINSAAT
jgi:hypothetical protein